MPINLQKGQNTSLSKAAPGLARVSAGLGWDVRISSGDDFDLDASACMLTASGKVGRDEDFIFFNNPVSLCGSVRTSGDNRTGAGDGPDETIHIELSRIPEEVQRVAVCVSIHEATGRRQNFGMVANAFVNIVNAATSEELVRFDLSEDFSTETAVIFGELYRYGAEWKFRAIGQGFTGGLEALLRQFGIQL